MENKLEEIAKSQIESWNEEYLRLNEQRFSKLIQKLECIKEHIIGSGTQIDTKVLTVTALAVLASYSASMDIEDEQNLLKKVKILKALE